MRLIDTRCAICDSLGDYSVVYKKNFHEEDLNAEIFSARRLPDRIHYQIVRCNNDGLVRSNPVLDESSLAVLYKKSRFTYADELENLAISYLDMLQPVLDGLPKAAKILEVGCGNGFILKELYDRGYKNVFGIEPSTDAAAKADAAVRERITIDVLKPGDFESNTFDLIFFFQTFDHIQDPGGFLRICRELAAPGGSILALAHDVESFQARILKEKSPIIDIEHTYLYSKETISKVFEKHGLSPVKVYGPADVVSLKHLIWLAPLPGKLKAWLLSLNKGVFYSILRKRIRIKLGNICIIAKNVP